MDKKEMHQIPPIKTESWLCLREFALRKTREKNRVVTMGEILEKALMSYFRQNNK